MSEVAIKVNGLGKKYALGGSRKSYKTLRESLVSAVRMPFGNGKGDGSSQGERSFWALKDINFEVNRGEVVGIIGRNGAGKSTLLKILSRITDPTEGEVDVIGRVGSLLEVGTGFHPELTGRENIFLNGAILGMKRGEIAAKFDEIVSFAETEKFLDTQVKHYSSGMYMRLAFAVAAHLEPEILVVDEVLAVGDAEFQKKCLGKMKEVGRSGRTVLFVSHNTNAIEQLCNRALLLDGGQLRISSYDVRQVISSHLFGTAEDSIDNLGWTNRGDQFDNDWFRPTRFYLADGAGKPIGPNQSNKTEAWITIEGDVRAIDPALTIGYCVIDDDGRQLYWSYQTDTEESCWPKIAVGKNKLRSRIPQRLLNEGTYRIELIGGLTNRVWLFEPGVNAPNIFLTIAGGLSDSPLWTARRPGVLAPVIPWEGAAASEL